ncbi:hypothetical protein M409DRAFT_28492 [Zasmidium cellare ATCC 36951]|uniref:Mitochondrial K+-H+ exchange-related-domain-containing protein n=1 Tax=Zasmidium cellare ATCC 36951 TaxID=1080233 RepID=A0A6A6C2E9_ZASCE|nr:uncharacterized protein M409DRAFT_28492 [Zasmidium cellare ATCC 36951]KAF2161165.1 hypothetical protein M409DRAFT_28492 [Zasmidium cellare ATCC 36951]
MRLFLLPISTRRTLIYCERVQEQLSGAKPPLQERVINKASQTWATWEKAEKGWQKQVTVYGNSLFKRIPYEEWGLKSIPPATKKRIEDINNGKIKFECLYPAAFIEEQKVPQILKALATERQALHRKNMWTSIAWMPITLPFTLVPVIPNLPFFYLVFRAWSHYKALYGSKLLEHLTTNNLIKTTDSKDMDELYAAGLLHPKREVARDTTRPTEDQIQQVAKVIEAQTNGGQEDVMLLQRWNGKLIAEGFHLPEMEIEIERAVEQVEKAIKSKEELEKEKAEVLQAAKSKTS